MKLIKYILGFACTALAFAACIKDDAPALGTRGSAYIKILEAPTNNIFFAPFITVDTFSLFSLRREEVKAADMDMSATIQLTTDTAAITAYNEANGTDYEALPDSLYTIVSTGVSYSGNTVTMEMPANVVGNEFRIAMDGSKWDVTHKYAMSFTISDSAGYTVRSGANSVFVTVEAKNQWDGVYTVEGTMTDIASPTLGNINLYLNFDNQYADPPMQLELRTISPTKCVCYDNYFYGGYYKAISVNNGDGTYTYSSYGGFCAVFEFDPETNALVSVTNYYGQPNPDNTRSAELDPSGSNQYDEASKSFAIKYWLNQPSVITDPPYHRVSFDETWTYIGERN